MAVHVLETALLAPLREKREALRVKLDALRARVRGDARAVPPPRVKVGTPLDQVNDAFHDHYERARSNARRDGPVFVLLADALVVYQGDRRTELPFTPAAFHVLKSINHIPVAIYAALEPRDEGPIDDDAQRQLRTLQQQAAGCRARLPEADMATLRPSTRDDLEAVIDASLAYLERVLRDGFARAALARFAGDLGPALLRLVRDATELQLTALHARADEALALLSPSERGALQVVVTGDHQARVRSLGMQYFRKRLAEPPELEQRVTYAEGVSDERAALALVGTRRLDRSLAQAFFGDERRLQRDILGDAAHALLTEFDVAPIP